jgi:hypothetical protein
MTEIATALDLSKLATCRSNAANGEGLLESLTTLSRQILERVKTRSEPSEADIVRSAPSLEAESAEAIRHDISEVPHDLPHADDSPHVVLLSREVVYEGKSIRIPLEITQGDFLRRLVVTVNIELE